VCQRWITETRDIYSVYEMVSRVLGMFLQCVKAGWFTIHMSEFVYKMPWVDSSVLELVYRV
jgi:hypothetical protein